MNLLTSTATKISQTPIDSTYSDVQNVTGVTIESASNRRQQKANSDLFCLGQRGAEVMQDTMNTPLYSRFYNAAIEKNAYTYSSEGIEIGGGDTMNVYRSSEEKASSLGTDEDKVLPSTSGAFKWFGSANDDIDAQKNCTDESNKEGIYECYFCKKRYLNARSVKVHLIKGHSELKEDEYPEFENDFIKSHLLVSHKNKKNIKKYACTKKCIVCNVTFRSNFDIKAHYGTTKHRERMNYLQVNFAKTATQISGGSLTDSDASGTTAGTSRCFEGANANLDVQQHQINEGNKEGVLTHCYGTKNSTSADNINSHLIVKKNKRKTKNICATCGMGFNRNGLLNIHMYKVHANKEHWYQCSECGKDYSDISTLKLHKERVHNPEHKPAYECALCVRAFDDRVKYRKHLETKKHSKRANLLLENTAKNSQ